MPLLELSCLLPRGVSLGLGLPFAGLAAKKDRLSREVDADGLSHRAQATGAKDRAKALRFSHFPISG